MICVSKFRGGSCLIYGGLDSEFPEKVAIKIGYVGVVSNMGYFNRSHFSCLLKTYIPSMSLG